MLRRASAATLFIAATGLTGPTGAAAQEAACEPSEADVEEARALFIAGSAAVEAGRWADATESFERAYRLSCAASALYNLALAFRALGRHREARDAFARLIEDHPDLRGEMAESAAAYQEEESARVAVLQLMGIEPELRPEIVLDGAPVADEGTRPLVVETDAGAHSLVARIPDHQPFLWDGTLSDGQREVLQVVFDPIADDEGGDDLDPVPFIVAGAAAAALAIAVGVGVFVYEDSRLQPLYPDRTIRVGD